MKEFSMIDYAIEDIPEGCEQSDRTVIIERDDDLENMVGYWYIVEMQNDELEDYLFKREDNYLLLRDATVDSITSEGSDGSEVRGVSLRVYGDIIEADNKEDLSARLV